MKVSKQTFITFTKEGASRKYYTSFFIHIQPVKKLGLCNFYSNRVMKHIMSILISIFISGYHGKTTEFSCNSSCHRTTIAHFLNCGKWDDTIASKTKPSSRALHPIEDAYFHQSHLKKKQDYGHQAVTIMLSCNGIVLNYAFVLYNKSISRIIYSIYSIHFHIDKTPCFVIILNQYQGVVHTGNGKFLQTGAVLIVITQQMHEDTWIRRRAVHMKMGRDFYCIFVVQ